jgi:sterol desaturase/sphingolipid hydroxylase (fatty acid hydroxylase superfamily)
MESLTNLFVGHVYQIVFVLGLGLLLGLGEKWKPANSTSAYNDYWVDAGAIAFGFVVSLVTAVALDYARVWDIWSRSKEWFQTAPIWMIVVITTLVVDLCTYFAHRLLHTRYFWRFHRWHHSPEHLFWYSGFRASAVHIVIISLPVLIVLAASGFNRWVGLTIGLQTLSSQLLVHSNFNVRIPWLGKVFILPQYHRIHHAQNLSWSNSNFGFIWTFWDRIFGTYTDPEESSASFPLGLSVGDRRPGHLKMMIGSE